MIVLGENEVARSYELFRENIVRKNFKAAAKFFDEIVEAFELLSPAFDVVEFKDKYNCYLDRFKEMQRVIHTPNLFFRLCGFRQMIVEFEELNESFFNEVGFPWMRRYHPDRVDCQNCQCGCSDINGPGGDA